MAATVIDTLIVRLGLDTSGLDQGQRRTRDGLQNMGRDVDALGNKLHTSGDKGSKAFGAIAKSAASFLAIIGGTAAIKRFVTDVIESSAALDRLSKNLQVNVETISAWSQAAEVAGGNAAGLQGSMDMISKAQTELMLTGQSGLIPYFSALGVSMTDAYGKALPVDEVLTQLATRFQGLDRTTANNMGRAMGLDQGTMNLLLKGRKEVEMMLQRQKEQGVVTKQQAEMSSKLREQIVLSTQSFAAFGRELFMSVAPALSKALSILDDMTKWMNQNQTFVKTFLGVLAGGLVAVGLAAIPISGTAAMILGLAAAIALLYDDWQKFKKGGDSLLDWSKIEPGLKAAVDGIKWYFQRLEDGMYRLIAGAGVIGNLMTGDFQGAKAAAREFIAGQYHEPLTKAPDSPEIGQKVTEVKPITRVKSLDTMEPATTTAPTDRQRFVSSAAKQLGVPEAVIDAHLRSETGARGQSVIGDYNYGNIKAGKGWAGQSKTARVPEYDQYGNLRYENAAFRSYADSETAGADYARLIASRYPGAAGAQNATDFATALKRGGYATDPNYISKISQIARGIPGAGGMTAGARAAGSGRMPSPVQTPSANSGATTTTVTQNVGGITINTQATDAQGILRDAGANLNYLLPAQANSGVN